MCGEHASTETRFITLKLESVHLRTWNRIPRLTRHRPSTGFCTPIVAPERRLATSQKSVCACDQAALWTFGEGPRQIWDSLDVRAGQRGDAWYAMLLYKWVRTPNLYRVCSQASSGEKRSCSMRSHSSAAVSMCFSVSTCRTDHAESQPDSLTTRKEPVSFSRLTTSPTWTQHIGVMGIKGCKTAEQLGCMSRLHSCQPERMLGSHPVLNKGGPGGAFRPLQAPLTPYKSGRPQSSIRASQLEGCGCSKAGAHA